jgi:hypothetical protein
VATDEGFLGRWSRRKAQGGADAPPQVPAAPATEHASPAGVALPVAAPQADALPAAAPADPVAVAPAAPPPTLDDVAQLDVQRSDFTRFVAGDVDPAVKNAALKKLFTDPQWNVMDGLDTYIDDYGRPDPLPEGMLRQMVQSHALGLFRIDEPPETAEPAAALAQNAAAPPAPETGTPADEDADLRLQPHDAAGRQSPGGGAGEDPGGER